MFVIHLSIGYLDLTSMIITSSTACHCLTTFFLIKVINHYFSSHWGNTYWHFATDIGQAGKELLIGSSLTFSIIQDGDSVTLCCVSSVKYQLFHHNCGIVRTSNYMEDDK